MNHLCNSHCEFCGADIANEYLEEGKGYTFFSLLLVATNYKFPTVLDYDFQADFSCSVCMECASRVLVSDDTSYHWSNCHSCGLNTQKEDFSAFRIVEVEAKGIERHNWSREPYDFISADTIPITGPIGHTLCMACVLPELAVDENTMMRDIVLEAISEGDVSEGYEEMIPT